MVTRLYFRLKLFILIFFITNYNLLSDESLKMSNINSTYAFELYKNKKLIIIDIRTSREWKSTGVIPNSLLLPMHDENNMERKDFIEEIKKVLNENQNKTVSFICASGARSEMVKNYFLDKGYKNILNISDGILGQENDGWFYLGFPLESYLEN